MEDAAGFDVFLSHSSADRVAVAGFAQLLRTRGLRPWLDVEQAVAGARFQAELAAGLLACRSMAVFVGAQRVGAWVMEELTVALSRAVDDRSFRVFLVLLPGAPEPFDATSLHPFLSQRGWVDLRGYEDDPETAGDELARAVRGEPQGFVDHEVPAHPGTVCPFPGLRAFHPDEAAWFFGRDADVQRMAEKLRGSPFVAVLGRSGVGKSSAVQAGLLPALASGRVIEGADRWPVRILRPTAAPLEALAAHLSKLRPDVSASQIFDDLKSSDVTLKLLTAAGHERCPVLWVVDQAEEMFTLCKDDGQRRAFAANLLHASQFGGPARVVVTLRSDFYPQLTELRAFAARIAQNQHVVADLDADQLGQVMTEPAALVGLSFEPGLVRRIVEDVGAQAAALPLLQHALRELWGRRRGGVLTHEAYDEIGRVEGALAKHADTALAKLDHAGDQLVVRRLMVELVRLGEGVEDTKQPVRLSDVVAPAYPWERVHRVASALADARLVTTDSTMGADADTTVELAHEALIRSWPQLRSWLEQSRDQLRALRRIREAARAWRDQGRPAELLYEGGVLDLALEQVEGRRDEMHELETEFLAASVDREQARQSLARQRTIRLRAAVGVVVALAVVAGYVVLGLFLTTSHAREDARRNAALAEDNTARALAQRARATASERPALALALAAEAHHRLPAAETADALQIAHLAYGEAPGHVQHDLEGHRDSVTAVAFSRDGTRIVTASQDKTAKVWDTATGDEVASLEGHDRWVLGAAFSPDGSLVATAGFDRETKLWNATTGEELDSLRGHFDAVTSVAFSPDGTRLATASRDGTAKLWDVATGEEVDVLEGHFDAVTSVAFSPDGTHLATGSRDETAMLWDLATGEHLVTFSGHFDAVTAVALSPDGNQIATASRDTSVRIWDTRTGDEVVRLTGHTSWVLGVAFRPEGSQVATASADQTARMWDPVTGDEVVRLTGHRDLVTSVAFSPDGTRLATGSRDRSATLWGTTTGDEVVRLTGHTDEVLGVAFSPDGTLVATASADGTAKLWGAATGDLVRELTGHRSEVLRVAFSTDGTLVGTAGADGTARLWDPETGDEVRSLDVSLGGGWPVISLAFSHDGRLLATALGDGTVLLWDVDTGELTDWFLATERELVGVAFSYGDDRLVTVGSDTEARVWDASTGDQVASLPGALHTAVFSPEDDLIATSTLGDVSLHVRAGQATLWDAGTGEEVQVLDGHTDHVWALAFNSDGTMLATASRDGTAKLWDTGTGDEIATLTGHLEELVGVAFSPDDTRVVTASRDATALVRHLVLTPKDACALVRGEVSREELVTALGGDRPRACTDLD